MKNALIITLATCFGFLVGAAVIEFCIQGQQTIFDAISSLATLATAAAAITGLYSWKEQIKTQHKHNMMHEINKQINNIKPNLSNITMYILTILQGMCDRKEMLAALKMELDEFEKIATELCNNIEICIELKTIKKQAIRCLAQKYLMHVMALVETLENNRNPRISLDNIEKAKQGITEMLNSIRAEINNKIV